jgi:dihydrofolate reductase
MVSSINGSITEGENPDIYSWTSEEDQLHFFSLLEEHSLIVMGARTYQHAKPVMKLKEGKLRLVLTRNPEQYRQEAVPGQLEFISLSPSELIQTYQKKGYNKLLLVGGSSINTLFFKAGCVDELQLTVEPVLVGSSTQIVDANLPLQKMKLHQVTQLNQEGTLLLSYLLI